MILGCIETEWKLSEWLKKHQQLDGIVITGVVDDALLENIRKVNLPYVVMGNYDISESHPQVTFDVQSKLIKELNKILKKSNFQRCAAVVGTSGFKADREVGEGFKAALIQVGIKVHPELICYASSDGYREAVFLHESVEAKTDLIYIHGGHAGGFQKYYNMHNCEQLAKVLALCC